MLLRNLECCGHEALESGLLAHELIDRPGMSAVERDTGFPQMTERALHMRASGRVEVVEMQVVAKGVLSSLEVRQESSLHRQQADAWNGWNGVCRSRLFAGQNLRRRECVQGNRGRNRAVCPGVTHRCKPGPKPPAAVRYQRK